MRITGSCHCGNISFELDWPGAPAEIAVRACDCTFCSAHGGVWTSHPDAALRAALNDPTLVSRYRFGTGTADFHVCSRCGVVPFVTSQIGGQLFAVVNANTLACAEPVKFVRATASFGGEETADRLERRRRNWIGRVTL